MFPTAAVVTYFTAPVMALVNLFFLVIFGVSFSTLWCSVKHPYLALRFKQALETHSDSGIKERFLESIQKMTKVKLFSLTGSLCLYFILSATFFLSVGYWSLMVIALVTVALVVATPHYAKQVLDSKIYE
ncbi:hypothetical protein [Vibrio phage JSF12]|uniref:Uncharacterized protein n=2 Tax=Jesfedecavirus TaxID=2560156 RepID=A0A2D0Z3M6_9CAUD|nr:hypothetical protein FDI98_gp012 [Vibrio phage JSF10]YP_009794732.1 hypothetical protein HOS35_gp049 [Vibrio phage JSF12]ASV43381.1 hypothetical protein [Vibrio phage JSF10]ASV43567.1 hypothetical protein [Vibrio phage JSF12]